MEMNNKGGKYSPVMRRNSLPTVCRVQEFFPNIVGGESGPAFAVLGTLRLLNDAITFPSEEWER